MFCTMGGEHTEALICGKTILLEFFKLLRIEILSKCAKKKCLNSLVEMSFLKQKTRMEKLLFYLYSEDSWPYNLSHYMFAPLL